MLSLSAWKERLKSLRDRCGHLAKVSRPIAMSIVASGALFLAAFTYRSWPTPWDWLQGGHDGQIIINSPTVYTRQRLVNDRLQQATWLQEQLKATGNNFRSVDQLSRKTAERVSGTGANAPPKAQGDADQDPTKAQERKKADQASADPILVESTTAADFRAKNLYRDEVRAEITQTELDDRHDINGNTIYRLAFNATVVAGTRARSVAGIRVALGHYPHGRMQSEPANALSSVLSFLSWRNSEASEEKKNEEREALKQLYDDDYKRLYFDWIRYMQTQVPNSIESVSMGITTGSPDPRDRVLHTRFLLDKVCQLKIEIETLAQGNNSCDPATYSEGDPGYTEASRNRNATLEFMSKDLELYFEKMEALSSKQFKQRLIPILLRDAAYRDSALKDQIETEDRYYETARKYCRQEIKTIFELSVLLPVGLVSANEDTRIGCPFFDSPAQRLMAGILLYQELVELRDKTKITKMAIPSLAKEVADRRNCERRKVTGDPDLCGYVNQQAAARCFAADFIKDRLNFFSRPGGPDRPGIDSFVRLDLVGRENGDCNLLVSELFLRQSYILKELTYLLNVDTEAFAYSISPKNFTENISTASETRDAFELLVRYGLPGDKDTSAFIKDLRKRSSELRAVIAHPIVVGFGSSRRELETLRHPTDVNLKTPVIRGTDFGWVIAPRMRDSELEQIDNQYELTAVISVPSWWRSVELDIEMCWQSREELSELKRRASDGLNICEDREKQTQKTVIRLPGAIAELSRKLGFEVLQEPYLGPNPRQVLEIGQKGRLLLKGARLWRSTEVTVGSQKANNIIVLPNMDGIIAEFNCVLPQLGNGGYDSKPIPTAAYVWTSEGVTTGAPVMLIWPDQDVAKGDYERLSPDKGPKREAKWCPEPAQYDTDATTELSRAFR